MVGKSVIYVNFSPYDNTGKTLDYLIENFSFVAHFSFDHLRLKNNRRARLTIFIDGEKIGNIYLTSLKTPPLLLFPSLPFVALAMFVETIWYSYLIKKQKGKIDYYLTVNAFPATTGLALKRLGIVRKTVFWVWDYFPVNFPDWRIKVMRNMYLIFDKLAIKYSDKIAYLNTYLRKSREQNGHHKKGKKFGIIPIGTNTHTPSKKRLNIIGHMGLIKESQGLDLLFDNLDEFFTLFPDFRIEIIGTGPEEASYKRKTSKYKKYIKFYGFMEDAEKIDNLIKRWKVGLATYIPTEWSEHYWGDPSKIKAYIANGTPVVTTKVPEFAKQVEIEKAGIVIDYEKNALFSAIKTLITENIPYSHNAIILSKKYDYRKVYPNLLA